MRYLLPKESQSTRGRCDWDALLVAVAEKCEANVCQGHAGHVPRHYFAGLQGYGTLFCQDTPPT